MRILYVASDCNRSGAALAMIELAGHIREMGEEVLLLFPGEGDAAAEARKRGLRCRVIRSYDWICTGREGNRAVDRGKWWIKSGWNWVAVLRIAFLIRRERIDLVHNNTLFGYVGALAAKLSRKPLIWHMRELLKEQGFHIRWKRLGPKLIASADVLIAISGFVREAYGKWFPGKEIRLVYDGVDTEGMRRGDRQLFAGERPELMMAGGIRPHKRQGDAVEAVALLREQGQEVHLTLVGDDYSEEYARKLKERVRELGLEKQVCFAGETDDMVSAWRKADIGITASQNEGFGRVTVEAMLAGCVTVVSDSGANREIVTDRETGYLYPVGEPEALSARIRAILEDPETAVKIAKRGQQAALERFDSRKNAEQVRKIYSNFES